MRARGLARALFVGRDRDVRVPVVQAHAVPRFRGYPLSQPSEPQKLAPSDVIRAGAGAAAVHLAPRRLFQLSHERLEPLARADGYHRRGDAAVFVVHAHELRRGLVLPARLRPRSRPRRRDRVEPRARGRARRGRRHGRRRHRRRRRRRARVVVGPRRVARAVQRTNALPAEYPPHAVPAAAQPRPLKHAVRLANARRVLRDAVKRAVLALPPAPDEQVVPRRHRHRELHAPERELGPVVRGVRSLALALRLLHEAVLARGRERRRPRRRELIRVHQRRVPRRSHDVVHLRVRQRLRGDASHDRLQPKLR
mmetsp:Transcript_11409/g.41150  ORF Transcript_11409/g.41150 Transcript_11409/m.41150 type:complete len:310 (+) Transcript_11409:289-1218(+)